MSQHNSMNPFQADSLAQAWLIVKKKLTRLAARKDFTKELSIAFNSNFDADKLENLREQWETGNFKQLPEVKVLTASEMKEANGAFSVDTNTIYLSENLTVQNAANAQSIAGVLLEEIGHFIDAKINALDTPGDEGAIFASFAQEQLLDEQTIQKFKAENDLAVLTLDGKVIQVEQAPEVPRHPVLIVPGVVGTFADISGSAGYQNFRNWLDHRGIEPEKLKIDPLLKVYDDLIQTLKNVGYEEGKDLFVANYDWRLPVAPRDGKIDGKIDGLSAEAFASGKNISITDETFGYGVDYFGYWLRKAAESWERQHPGIPLESVDVVAHSTGGLITRSYIQSDAYGGSFLSLGSPSGRLTLPKINNFLMIGVPNRGASKAWNPLHNNFIVDASYQYVLSKILNNAYRVVSKGGVIKGLPASISLETIKDPATGKSDPIKFINQYLPLARDLLATYNFIDSGSPINPINNNPSERNSLVLDLNAGLDFQIPTTDPSSFASKSKVTAIYSTSEKTPVTVTRKVGNQSGSGKIAPFTDFVARNPNPDEVWYQDNLLNNSGDGTVPVDSTTGQFKFDSKVKLEGFAKGVNTQDTVTHTGLMSNVDVQELLLKKLGFTEGEISGQISTNLEGSDLGALFRAVRGADIFQLRELPLSTEPAQLSEATPDSFPSLDAQDFVESLPSFDAQDSGLVLQAAIDSSSGLNEDSSPDENNFLNLPNLLEEVVSEIKFPLLGNNLKDIDLVSEIGLDDIKDVKFDRTSGENKVTLKLQKDFNQLEIPIAADFGLPNLGLALNNELKADIGLDWNLKIGVNNNTGFFIDTADPDELKLTVKASVLDLNAIGQLGFLQFKVNDDSRNPTNLSASFAVDIQGDSQTGFTLKPGDVAGSAHINLHLDSSLKGLPDLPAIGELPLPEIQADFNLNDDRLDDDTPPTIGFNNITLDAGSFVNRFAGDVLKNVQSVVKPIDRIVGVLNNKLPVLNESPIQLASQVNVKNPNTAETVKQSISFINQIHDFSNLEFPTDGSSFPISLGSVNLKGDVNNTDIKNLESEISSPPSDSEVPDSETKQFIDQLREKQSKQGNNLQFPILTEPKTVVDLLRGRDDVELFTYTSPQLGFGIKHDLPPIPVFGPIVVTFTPHFGASAQIEFGFDTVGLKEFRDDGFKAPEKISDGFFVAKPKDNHNISLEGGLDAKAGVNVGAVDVGIGGGINANLNVDVAGGKQHLNDIAKFLKDSPLCIFEEKGALSAIIFAALELDFGFVSFTKRIDLANINLIDFKTGCEGSLESHFNVQNPEPDAEQQAQLAAQGVIDRKGTANADTIRVIANNDNLPQDLLLVGLDPDPGKNYENVKIIVLNGGAGSDRITLDSDVRVPSQLYGAEGDDTLIGGAGVDFMSGGAGSDVLDGGVGGKKNTAVYADVPDFPNDSPIKRVLGVTVNLRTGIASSDGYGTVDTLRNIQNVEGSKFNDTLIASDTGSVLDAGDGDDNLTGGAGNDVILGGRGADRMDGRGGVDTTTYIGSTAPVLVNLSAQDVSVASAIEGVESPLLQAHRGYGGEAEGDRISNIENVQGSVYDDILVANDSGGQIDSGLGNDVIYAGLGRDNLNGGQGIDWLSYRLSENAVNVNLATGSASGGYAEGDTVQTRNVLKDAANQSIKDEKGNEITYRSFENLEGSNDRDALTGDEGNNILSGLAGDDSVFGGSGNDTLIGGGGADRLEGGSHFGTLQANSSSLRDGGDVVSYQTSAEGVAVNLGSKDVPILSPNTETEIMLEAKHGAGGDAEGDQFFNVENMLGSAYGDQLFGDDTNNDINPGLSNRQVDRVDGGEGIDRLTINFSINDATEYAGLYCDFNQGYLIRDGSGETTQSLTDYPDDHVFQDQIRFSNMERLYFIGTGKTDHIVAGSGSDILLASAGDDYVDGGLGNDDIQGDDGNDRLIGDRGNDTLNGGEGNDTLIGTNKVNLAKVENTGSFTFPLPDFPKDVDTLIGGAGADTFVLGDENSNFYNSAGKDDYALIKDFNLEQDKIQLRECPDFNEYFLAPISQGSGTEIGKLLPSVGNSRLLKSWI